MKRTAAERIYEAALWLHPPGYRRRWREQVLQDVRTASRHDTSPGALVRLCRDALVSLCREWRDAIIPSFDRMHHPPRHGEPMRNLLRDFSLSARLLAKTPLFTIAAVTTLALGIGANAAVFTVADATLLRPLAVRDPQGLVVWSWSSSWPHFQEYARRGDIFQGVMASGGAMRLNLSIDGSTELIQAGLLSGNAFDVLGIKTTIGRTLLPGDDVVSPIVGVLSYGFWTKRFGQDPNVVGRVGRVNGHPITIVGVAERSFRGVALASNPDVFIPASVSGPLSTGFFGRVDRLRHKGFVWLSVIGRLNAGTSVEQATAAMDTLYTQLEPPAPGTAREERLRLEPLTTETLGSAAADVHRFIWLLSGAVGLTLLIACANLANLLLVRGATRRREVGVRLALGAGRGRIVQQMLSESCLLAFLGGGAGLLLATAMLRAVQTFQLPGGLRLANLPLEISGTAIAVTFGISLLTGLLFGAAPSWRASRADVLDSLRGQTRAVTAKNRLRSVLVAAQIAMSLVLLAGTGLFTRSLMSAMTTELGFRPDGVTTATMNLGLAGYDASRARAFYDAALERVRALPQVTHAAWSNMVPTRGVFMWNTETQAGKSLTVYAAHVGPGYFETVGTGIREGRGFQRTDRPGAEPVGIVNEEMARQYFGGEALGKRIKMFDTWITIVGVVENTRVRELRERPAAQVYLAFGQWLEGKQGIATDTAHLFVKTRDGDPTVIPLIREGLKSLDPELPLYSVTPFNELTAPLTLPQRMGATLFALFSAVALTLAGVGVYGVASYVAALRRREIGVRVALGASSRSIRKMVLAQGGIPVVAGIVAGVLGALYASRAAQSFLLGVSPRDPVTFGIVTTVLAGVAVLASWIPARRAAQVDPIEALREE